MTLIRKEIVVQGSSSAIVCTFRLLANFAATDRMRTIGNRPPIHAHLRRHATESP